ncbi:hypothetical protein SDC9_21322 [bioreactor metagenome]|uniref:Uncharacterized protein n=1 Tax=bioreactor metagenome TaxID=1076179 RepID=A0A644U975_9ZZZZ
MPVSAAFRGVDPGQKRLCQAGRRTFGGEGGEGAARSAGKIGLRCGADRETGGQAFSIVHPDRAPRGIEGGEGLGMVEDRGAVQQRAVLGSGLERGVAALFHKGAADEADPCRGIPVRHLAHGIGEQHRRRGGLARRAGGEGKATGSDQPGNLGAAPRVARRKDEPQRGGGRAGAGEGVKDDLLLARVRRGGEQGRLARPAQSDIGFGQAHGGLQVDDRQRRAGGQAEGAELGLGGRVLRRKRGDRAHQPRAEPGLAPASGRACRHPRADGEDRQAAGGTAQKPVRPELVLDHDQRRRPVPRQKSGKRPAGVERRRARRDPVVAPAKRHRPGGDGVRGDQKPQPGPGGKERGDQRLRRDELAIRGGMEPDRPGRRGRAAAKPLGECRGGLGPAQHPQSEPDQQHGQGEGQEQAIEEEHGQVRGEVAASKRGGAADARGRRMRGPRNATAPGRAGGSGVLCGRAGGSARRQPFLARLLHRRVRGGDEGVEHRHHEEREHRADQQAREHHDAHGLARGGAGALGDDQRHDRERHRRGGHQDRPQTGLGGKHDRLAPGVAVFLALLVGEFDHQDAVLGDQTDEGDQPDLAVDVQRAEPEVQRQDRAEDRQRHRHQDDEGVAEAFELRRQHEIDHQHRGAEGERDGIALLHLEPRLARIVDEEALGHHLLGDLHDRREPVAGRLAGHRQRRDRGRVQLVELLDRRGHHPGLDLHHRGQRHHLAGRGADEILAELFGVRAERLRHLGDDVVGVRVAVELRHGRAADEQAEGVADLGDRDVQRRGAVAVDRHPDLGRIEVERVLHHDELARFLRLDADLLGHFGDPVGGVDRLDHHRDRQPAAGARQGGRREGKALEPGRGVDRGLDLRLDLLLAAGAIAPVLQRPDVDALVLLAAEPGDREIGAQLGDVLGVGADPVDVFRGVIRGRIARPGQHRDHRALVLFRRELGRGVDEHEAHHRDQHDNHRHRHRTVVERAVDPPFVPAREALEGLVDPGLEARGMARFQDPPRHHRGDGERDDAGQDHRARQGEGEFLEQRAGQSAGEAERREHGGKGDRHRDHRAGDLLHPLHRGRDRFHPVLDMAVDVLHHHDRIVDHKADRQHHGQQREQVDRIAKRQQHRHHADERERDGDDRHQHRAQRAEEEQDHHDDDRHGLADGLEHLVDRGRDLLGRVIDELDLHPVGQRVVDRRQLVAHRLRGVERVRRGRRREPDEGALTAGEGDDLARVVRGELNPRHVAQPHHLVAGGADRQRAEGLGRLQRRFQGDRLGDVDVLGLARRRQEVRGLDRRQHLGGGDVARSQLVGVDPDPHRVVRSADDADLGDARDRRHPRLDHALEVFGQLLGRHVRVDRRKVHQREGAPGALHDHRVIGFGGQLAAHLLHLRQHLGQGRVGVRTELHVDRHHRGRVHRGGGDVVDVLGRRHRLGDRCGDEALDQVRRGAGVGGGDRHHRLVDLGILPDRQVEIGLDAEQQHEGADHRRQDGASDEDFGEMHRASLSCRRPERRCRSPRRSSRPRPRSACSVRHRRPCRRPGRP